MKADDEKHMQTALDLARKGYGRTSPNPMVGAVLVKGRAVIGKGWHRHAGGAHAEVEAIRNAERNDYNVKGATLYVTLEPCALCASAIVFARLRKVVFGAYDPKGGGVEHGPRIFDQPTIHHAPEVIGGVMETECAAILQVFFAKRR